MTDATPSFRQRLKDRRAAAAWWGVLALLVQVLVPLGQAVPVMGADGLPRSLVLCSAMGARTVPLPGAPSPEATPSCAVCLAYGSGSATLLPATPAAPLPPAVAGTRIDQPVAALAHGLMSGLPRARSPPMVV